MIADLVKHQVCYVDDANTLLTTWVKEDQGEQELPELLKTLPKDKGKFDQGSALVCWEVLNSADQITETWKDSNIAMSWSDFLLSKETGNKLCSVSGQMLSAANNHPAKIRHSGDKAKLISFNDTSGFTFRGRASDKGQITDISSIITQKAHSALAWLIANQPKGRTGDQHLICWANSLNRMPDPLQQSVSFFDDDEDDNTTVSSLEDLLQNEVNDQTLDLGARFANRLQLQMRGYFSGNASFQSR